MVVLEKQHTRQFVPVGQMVPYYIMVMLVRNLLSSVNGRNLLSSVNGRNLLSNVL